MQKSTVSKYLLLGLLVTPLVAEFELTETRFIPWQQGEQFGVVLRETPGGPFGPESFSYTDELTVILDSQGKRALLYANREDVEVLDLPVDHPRDILMEGPTPAFLLYDNQVLKFENNSWNTYWTNQRPDQPINRLSKFADGRPHAILNMESTVELNSGSSSSMAKLGLAGKSEERVNVSMSSRNRASIRINNQVLAELNVSNLGSIQYLGSSQNSYFILLEIITQQIPLRVAREIRVIDASGRERTRITGLQQAHTLMSKEFIITKKGDILHLLPLEDGVHLLKWQFNDSFPAELEHLNYPEKLRYEPEPEPLDSPPKNFQQGHLEKAGSVPNFAPVTRAQALVTGDSYVTHTWTATAHNITNGLISDPYGKKVETPSWVTVGAHAKLPYQWGGFSTLSGFDNGLQNGKYAGDRNTDNVSSWAVSVDCSGFVSRCWNLTSHYSTYMMHKRQPLITIAYGSWDDLKPGDAIHKQGHVRLFVQKNDNGTLLAVESTSREWRVSYYTYTLSDLSAYLPRYYINMEGNENMPSAISHPILEGIQGAGELTLNWKLADTTGIKGFRIYGKNEIKHGDWQTVNSELIPAGTMHHDIQTVNPSSWSYHVKAVNHEGYESHPTDSYTHANKGSSDKLLIVDGFDRWAWQFHDFSLSLGTELAKYNYTFTTVDNDAVVAGTVDLSEYKAVFWNLGDESTADESFSNSEQDLVENYLKQGGKLFISGSEIAWDLDYKAVAQSDKDFLHNFVHVSYDTDDSESYTVGGVTGTGFEGLDLHFDNGTHGIYTVGYPDTYTLTNGSEAVLRYANNDIAAAAFEGVSPGGTQTSQVLIMGFPFETIYTANERSLFVHALLDHFQLSTALNTDSYAQNPKTFMLHPAYPNPFNPSTTISYDLPKYSSVKVTVLDLLGREVAILVNADNSPGSYTVQWNGMDHTGNPVSTGVYFAHLQAGSYHQTIKMLYLR